jgi:hypothetical protein
MKQTKYDMTTQLQTHKEQVGKRVKLIEMNDPFPIESGTEGTIVHVDDMNQYHVKWDNGRTLSLIPDEDSFEIID